MIEIFPSEFVSKLRNGKVLAIGVPSTAASLADLEDYAEQELSGIRVIGLRQAKFPPHDQLLTGCVRSIAAGAIALWPDWYGADVDAGKTAVYPKEVSSLWLEKAEALVSVGKLPLPSGYPNAIHVAQIALALGSPHLVIAIAVTEANLGVKELKSVVATTTWLAIQSQAKIALLVPQNLVDADEFDQVIKESLERLVVAPETEPSIEELPVVTVTSINGRPNPTSPGEMLLAARLAKDPELEGIFSFNQAVKSVHGKEYKVDLLWLAGKLVVEVDGYSFHSSAFAFGQDRHRDYELLISGYRVLRLTHEEIFKDTPRSIAKIRDSVHFLNKNPAHGA